MRNIHLLSKSVFFLLTISISLSFTSCNQEDIIQQEDIVKGIEVEQEIKLNVKQEHKLVLDRILNGIIGGSIIKPNNNVSFFVKPLVTGCKEIKNYLYQLEGEDPKEWDELIVNGVENGLILAEKWLLINQSREVTLSDLINMSRYSYADKLIIQLLENTLSREYDSMEQRIADISLLIGISNTEEVNNGLEIAISSLRYWEENLDKWEEVIIRDISQSGIEKNKSRFNQVVYADIAGGLSEEFKESSSTGVLIGAATASMTQGVIGILKEADFVYYDQEMIFDDGTNKVTKKEIMSALKKQLIPHTIKDRYVEVVWEN